MEMDRKNGSAGLGSTFSSGLITFLCCGENNSRMFLFYDNESQTCVSEQDQTNGDTPEGRGRAGKEGA